MRRTSATRLFLGLAAFSVFGLLCSLPLIVIGYHGYVEHARRVSVLRSGESVLARVTRSHRINSRECVVQYQFSFAGSDYVGGEGECALVNSHPVGSQLVVRFTRSAPEESVAVGSNVWPDWIGISALIGMSLLGLGGLSAYAIFKEASGPASRRKSLR